MLSSFKHYLQVNVDDAETTGFAFVKVIVKRAFVDALRVPVGKDKDIATFPSVIE